MPKVSVKEVTKRYGQENSTDTVALVDVSFDVARNEFVSIVGKSGCGKSTMLGIIAGLLSPTKGLVEIDGHSVAGPGLDRGMVFQQASLFPWLTAVQNIEFGPRSNGVAKDKYRELAKELIELVALEGFENMYPRQLSGGMQQRVAIARALAIDPEILLMDEPFGALDQLTREDMQRELLRIWEQRRKTVIFVTHSITEAVYLSDRVLVLSRHPGRLIAEFEVTVPRPRQKSSQEFLQIYEAIYNKIDEG
jgi:ABC-type nitrate/sulfonate/bicarbonate transport system ATPase subunit